MTDVQYFRRAAGTVLASAALAAAGALVAPAAPAQAFGFSPRSPYSGSSPYFGYSSWNVDTVTGTSVRSSLAAIGATDTRLTGHGIGIAMVDTGVTPVAGLTGGNVVNGPDLSFDSQDPATQHIDRDGHGTHLAGIMVGRAAGDFSGGVAPDAKLISVKVGAGSGVVDVGQVIAGIDWVVAHRLDDPTHRIRVLELAYGTDSVQSSLVDPLAHAVETAWRAGIVVVTAGGNAGGNTPLLDPATDPYVIAVGALDTQGTASGADDRISDFTSRGETKRRLDVVMPGRSIISLRAPGSAADTGFPSARVGANAFKGSGSSQATAFAAGAVALILQNRPTLTPDQVKGLITRDSRVITAVSTADNGLRAMNLAATNNDMATTKAQTWARSTGLGTLEGSRGSVHISDGTTELRGESDIFGPLSTASWAEAATNISSWNAKGQWMGRDMTGSGYSVDSSGMLSWAGRAWSGRAWSGRAWSAARWSSSTWSGNSWSGDSWN
ncbi:MAG: serine protease AprX [Actinoplanes sp.]|nr:serine protease AprX [Actinoplanes sp.]